MRQPQAQEEICRPLAQLVRAGRIAVRNFAEIGVPVVFLTATQRRSDLAAVRIDMQLVAQAPIQFHPGAMAYAMPYGVSGTRIYVFSSRVTDAWPDAGTGAVLGHVLAHEIAHVLEGVNRHSANGIMRAHWAAGDFRQMISGTLPFDPADTKLIHDSLEKQLTMAALPTR